VCLHLYLGSVFTPERCTSIISCFSVFTQVAFSEAALYPTQSDRESKKGSPGSDWLVRRRAW
jgi:hypothetical protein